ncbi:hypothetical protein CR155_15790 [Pollutimonas nitritireducens]|uniref:Receptor protein-tyrosine kinase n=1 Tax=Pollutimonas nitritireducens TaxID=2045209 RepID=A0A2N4UD00_9BURK|nr:hypothetical protein [Pollutimonas nitritireducens]PLC52867.1 hypothetical protein CR155_15790 [Pollutimonas nitritireducens]
MHERSPTSMVFYRPIEAAIRWVGLLRYEQEILSEISSPRNLPRTLDYPRWDELLLCLDRIYDAVINRELPYGQNGVTLNDESLFDSTELTIRHIDLKRWMRIHYPEHRPRFLFSRSERIAHPFITLEAGQAMLIERQAKKVELEQCRRQVQVLQEQHESFVQQSVVALACNQCAISDRAETTYLNIIGGMLTLILGTSPSGKAYSSFRTQEAVVSALVAHHQSVMGITERTLNGKFASAKRRLHSANS